MSGMNIFLQGIVEWKILLFQRVFMSEIFFFFFWEKLIARTSWALIQMILKKDRSQNFRVILASSIVFYLTRNQACGMNPNIDIILSLIKKRKARFEVEGYLKQWVIFISLPKPILRCLDTNKWDNKIQAWPSGCFRSDTVSNSIILINYLLV